MVRQRLPIGPTVANESPRNTTGVGEAASPQMELPGGATCPLDILSDSIGIIMGKGKRML